MPNVQREALNGNNAGAFVARERRPGAVRAGLREFLRIFLPLFFLINSLFFYVHYKEDKIDRRVEEIKEQNRTRIGKISIQRDLVNLISDLFIFTSEAERTDYPNREDLTELANEWEGLLRTKQIYDQIRFLDKSGMEIVRVNYNNDAPEIVPEGQLQDKSKWDYFKESLPLADREIHISRMNLNVELGLVETPLKPVLTISTPIYDDLGRKRGVLVLNYLVSLMIERFRSVISGGGDEDYLLNNNGFILSGPRVEEEWGHVLDGRPSFATIFPEIWRRINKLEEGQLFTKKKMVTFTTIHPAHGIKQPAALASLKVHESAKGQDWKLVTLHQVGSSGIFERLKQRPQLTLLFTAFMVMSTLGSFLLSQARLKRRYALKELQNAHDESEERVHDRTKELSREINVRKRMESMLRTSEKRKGNILGAAIDGIITIDEKGEVVEFNPSAEAMFGYRAKEVVGKEIANLIIPPDLRERHIQGFKRHLETGKKRIIGKRTELRATRRSGEEFPMELTITTFEEGEKRMFTAFVRDISEREQILGTLQVAKEEAEAANRAKTDFLSSMSHELRTPMNAVLGFSQLLRRSKKEPLMSKQAKHVEQIEKAGNHLLELINEVLDLSKIESGKLLLSLEDISPSIVVLEAFNLVVPMAETQNIKLVDKTGGVEYENVIVKADYTRFKQVLVNLLSNAVKYSRDVGAVTLEYGEASQEGFVRFSVIDCGLGIPEGKLKEIFQPFTRLGAEDQDIEGTGVGLSITEKLVKLMDGKVGAESIVGEGSTFWFELPLGGEKNGEETESQVKAVKVGKGRERKCTMLYVEDNPANLRLMEEILADLPNLTLLSAHTPQLGLKLARVCKADLIVLDINLPGLNGFKILKRMRNYNETKDIPVIAISANAMPKDIEKGLSAGFLAYLTKPLDIDQFLEVVESTLGRGKQ